MDFGAAFGKPFSNIKNLVIGIVLSFIPIINILTIPGYMLRVANKTMNKDNALPGFDGFGDLIVNSLKLIVVGIVYWIISIIVTIILVSFIPVIGGLLVIIWMIVFSFTVLSAMMTLAKTGGIGAALNVPAVMKKAANAKFIIATIVGAVIMAIVMAIILVIVGLIAGASLLPTIMGMSTGAAMDPAVLAPMIMGLIGAMAVGVVVMMIVGYILMVFFYSLVAESYSG